MVNNFIKRRLPWLVRRPSLLAFTIVAIFYSLNSFSQNISKYYNSVIQQNGTLYFILPQEGFNNNSADFIYDLTYLTSLDSVTLNFSIITEKVIEADSIRLISDSVSIPVHVTRLFVEPRKSKWHARYTSKILFSSLDSFYSGKTPPVISVFTGKEKIELNIQPGKWNKLSGITHRIFDLINYNKK
jgi:hypothetical protein